MLALNFQPLDGSEDIAVQDFIQNKDILTTGTGAGAADTIQVWDGTKFEVYFYKPYKSKAPNKFTDGPAWVNTTSATEATKETIKRGSGIWFIHPGKDPIQLTVSGSVNATAKTHDLMAGYNMISSAFPVDMKLNNGPIDWVAAGAVAGTGAGAADTIQVWNGEDFDIYFYKPYKSKAPNKFTDGPAWVSTTAATEATKASIPAGRGFWYIRPGTEGGSFIENSPLAK